MLGLPRQDHGPAPLLLGVVDVLPHDREHTEQDMHSEWFARADVEQMMREGEITDAQSLAAWTLFLLSER